MNLTTNKIEVAHIKDLEAVARELGVLAPNEALAPDIPPYDPSDQLPYAYQRRW